MRDIWLQQSHTRVLFVVTVKRDRLTRFWPSRLTVRVLGIPVFVRKSY